ncbi:MAG: hypothetical protein ABIS07_06750 [Dokdonella sp.]
MPFARKIVLHSRTGYTPQLDVRVNEFMRDGVAFVAVVGVDASRVEDIVDELCVGDGSAIYSMLTSFHENETVEEAVAFAESLTGEFAGKAQIVDF